MNRFFRWWMLVPALWLLAVVAVMRPGCLEYRFNVQFGKITINMWQFSAAVYDSADIAAFALRGANASLGRLPGRTDEPLEDDDVKALERRLDAAQPPLAEKYYLEYPSATLAIFRLGFLTPCEMPAAVADSHQYSVAHFLPREDKPDEVRLWSRFHQAAIVHLILMTVALYGLIFVLRCGYEPGGNIGPVWLCVLPAAVFFSLNRFDIVPAFATAVAFACLGRNRFAASGAFLAVGVLLKIYPVLFVPVVLRYLGVRNGAKWLAGYAGMMLLGIGLSWATLGWEPTVRPILVQLARPLEPKSWTLYGRVLPLELGHSKNARLAILAAVGLALVLTRPKDLHGVLRRCSVLVLVFISLAVFWSPQWVVWFLPMVVPLAARTRWLVFTCVAIDAMNYLQFPVLFWIVWDDAQVERCKSVAEGMIYLRAVLWSALAAGLLRCEFRPRNPARYPSPAPSA